MLALIEYLGFFVLERQAESLGNSSLSEVFPAQELLDMKPQLMYYLQSANLQMSSQVARGGFKPHTLRL